MLHPAIIRLTILVYLYPVCIYAFCPHGPVTTCGQQTCQDLPRNCMDIKTKGCNESGVYVIYPGNGCNFNVKVYCDMDTDSGGWTVIQRRMDGSINFFHKWNAYEEGFGNPEGEYWLGLFVIHMLTEQSPQEVRSDMMDFEGTSKYAEYSTFSVADGLDGYRLTVTDYSGDAGDGFGHHNNRTFSTFDRDQDAHATNCAARYKSGWWYGACHDMNPNGLYLSGPHTTDGDGVNWKFFRGHFYSLKKIDIKIRPI